MSIVLGGEGQVSPVLLTGPLTLPPAEALLMVDLEPSTFS